MKNLKTVGAVAAALALGAAGGVYFSHPQTSLAAPAVKPAKSTAPVVKTTVAAKRDVPIFVTGIGRVQALNTAQVKSRIDGPIEKVLFTEGETVAAGKPLFEIDARPYRAALAQAEGQLARDQAQYASAKTDYDRATNLVGNGFISQQTLEQREALMAGYAAAIRVDQGALDNARLNLDFTTIRAPIAGRIGKRLVDTGNLIHGTDGVSLAEIVQTRPITALFTVPQGALPEIRSQMKAGALSVEAVSTDDRRSLSRGTLQLIGNQVDPTTGTVELKASFDNEDDALWPGQLIEARLTMQYRRDVIAVPVSAVQPGAEGQVVFVVDLDNKIAVRKVILGPVSEGRTVVESGLEAGDKVVVEKLDMLAPGLAVQAEAS
ncbi:MAG TPA: efflux RND transporter periplasmic adaptor subunit [Magnetospirillaceae bacterium]|nr:efflux RND transporter periplasmic adaptor subunit [Magnetospirillaceae bacterium]